VLDRSNEDDMLAELTVKRLMIWLAVGLATALPAYLFWLRPRHLKWGATNAELTRPMPGDGIVKLPTFNATRAVTIGAEPEDIWPWLVQIGCKRAGWYSYGYVTGPCHGTGKSSR
jgi:hypothetical protein